MALPMGIPGAFGLPVRPPMRSMANSADELDKSLLARLVGESDTLDGSCHVAFRFWRMYHLDVCESPPDPRVDVDE